MDFIENKIMGVLEHHTVGLTGPKDTIDEGVGGKRKREDQFLTSQIQINPFSFVEHHNAGKATVIMSNLVAKNPCSFESLKDVLKTIKNETTGDERKWRIVGCDGRWVLCT